MIDKSNWRTLFAQAESIINKINADYGIIDFWTLGGGTALMLQINHRSSKDIDIFFDDPQYLPFFDPSKNDFDYSIEPSEYGFSGDSVFKFDFPGYGSIDFICAPHVLKQNAREYVIDNSTINLDTPLEILIKKLVYRGDLIQPRDIYDIACVTEINDYDDLLEVVSDNIADIENIMNKLEEYSSDFVSQVIGEMSIPNKFMPLKSQAYNATRSMLLDSQQRAHEKNVSYRG